MDFNEIWQNDRDVLSRFNLVIGFHGNGHVTM